MAETASMQADSTMESGSLRRWFGAEIWPLIHTFLTELLNVLMLNFRALENSLAQILD